MAHQAPKARIELSAAASAAGDGRAAEATAPAGGRVVLLEDASGSVTNASRPAVGQAGEVPVGAATRSHGSAASEDPQPSALGDPSAGTLFGWVERTFPGHAGAFWGGLVGLLAAVAFFALGLVKTLVIAILMLVGVAVGQLIDGDPKLINLVRRLFSSGQN